MSLRTRSFCIYYFSDPTHFTAKSTAVYQRISVTWPSNTEHHTVGQVKKEAGKAAKLLPSSLKIFGLFLGDEIGLPRKFCPDEAIVPGRITEFSFQLASFNQDIENEVICKDERAMELVYWELKNQWGNYGFPFMAQVECNKAFFTMHKNITQKSKVSSSHILNFLQTIRMKSPIFIAHYHHVRHIETKLLKEHNEVSDASRESVQTKMMTTLTYCYTSDIISTEKVAPIKEGRRPSRARFHMQKMAAEPVSRGPINITVALNVSHLVILDALGRTEYMSLDWSYIKLLRMNIKRGIFIIDFLTNHQKTRSITIKTDCSSFLFSISQHLISLKSPKPEEELVIPLHLQTVQEFTNPMFNNMPVSEKKLVNLIEEKYAEIPMWDNEVEENEFQTGDITEGIKYCSDTLSNLRSFATLDADTPTWNTMASIKESLEHSSGSQDKSSSILQTPSSQLLSSNDGYNCNMTSNQTTILSPSIRASDTTSLEADQDTHILKSPLYPRRPVPSLDQDFRLEECGDKECKDNAGKRKKPSSDAIPRVPGGKSSSGNTFKSSYARTQAHVKGKSNAKSGLQSK